MKTRNWLAEAVWRTSASHIRDVVATKWPTPGDAHVKLIAQPGSADLRTRVEVRAAHPEMNGDVAIRWLEGLAERLLVTGSSPRLIDEL